LVNVRINRQYEGYIRPLDQDIHSVFDPNKNKYLKNGKAKRWILKDGNGQLAGRIAAFMNPRYRNKGDRFKMGGIGFFDCIDNQDAANLLFDTAKEWLQKQGGEAMDGPINLGERDRWWGLLTEGFHEPPYGLNYNPPYYQKLFENYGWRVFYNQICWKMPIAGKEGQLSAKFYESHEKFDKDPDYSAHHVRKNQLNKFAKDFAAVYNEAWANHQGNKEMSVKQAAKLFNTMKPIMDEKIVWFAYHKDRPVAMWLNLPDINQLFKHFNGQFHLINKLRFLWMKRKNNFTKMMGVAYGIVPDFQRSGIDYYMIVEGEKVIKSETKYNELELQWQGDFNPKMLNISRNLEAQQARLLKTYRYNFDPNIPVERHPVI